MKLISTHQHVALMAFCSLFWGHMTGIDKAGMLGCCEISHGSYFSQSATDPCHACVWLDPGSEEHITSSWRRLNGGMKLNSAEEP